MAFWNFRLIVFLRDEIQWLPHTHIYIHILFRFPLSYFILSIAIVLPMRRKRISIPISMYCTIVTVNIQQSTHPPFLSLSLSLIFGTNKVHGGFTTTICCQVDLAIRLMCHCIWNNGNVFELFLNLWWESCNFFLVYDWWKRFRSWCSNTSSNIKSVWIVVSRAYATIKFYCTQRMNRVEKENIRLFIE